ncbi:hypothetical protein FOJ82_10095, partial [Tessaracoccus rhinocerotis]
MVSDLVSKVRIRERFVVAITLFAAIMLPLGASNVAAEGLPAPSLVEAVLSPTDGQLELDETLSVSVTFQSDVPISSMYISWTTPTGGRHSGGIYSWTKSGDHYSGSIKWTLSEPDSWPSGQYSLEALSVTDTTGRTTYFAGPGQIHDPRLAPDSLDFTVTNSIAPPAPPSLVEAVLSPTDGQLELDETLSASVTFQSDVPISSMYISWTTPTGGRHSGGIYSWTKSGDHYSGSIKWTLSEPDSWPSGQYSLEALSVTDTTGRTTYFAGPGQIHDPRLAPDSLDFTVTNSIAPPAPPSLVEAVLSPTDGQLELDETLSVSVTFQSDVPISSMYISWTTPTGGRHSGGIYSWTKSGDHYSGSIKWTLSEPDSWPSGQYSLEALSVTDTTGRTTYFAGPGQIHDPRLAPDSLDFTVGTFVSPPTDTAAPVLQEFDYTPTAIDVADGPQEVVVTARVTDATGAAAPTLILSSDDTTQTLGFGEMTRISGTAQDGIYQGTVT